MVDRNLESESVPLWVRVRVCCEGEKICANLVKFRTSQVEALGEPRVVDHVESNIRYSQHNYSASRLAHFHLADFTRVSVLDTVRGENGMPSCRLVSART
jgi:hypothetical protein